jgi:hypothetical protein
VFHGKPDRSTVRPQGNSAVADKRRAEFEAALRELADALAARKVDEICAAYLALRQAGQEMAPQEILRRAAAVDGKMGPELIISAFSRRRCFMCEDGTTACSTCEGAGVVDGRPCSACDGQGVEVCAFCMGLGWSDEAETPAEIRPQVRRRRVAHLKRDLEKLAKLPLARAVKSASHATGRQRQQLAPWLIRLQARLTKAGGTKDGDAFAATCRTMSERVNRLLEALRPKPASALAEDDLT